MRVLSTSLLALVATTATLAAQTDVFVPAITAIEEGNDLSDTRMFSRDAFRAQQIVASSYLAPTSADLTAIAYRIDNDNSSGSVATTFDNVTVDLSATSVDPGSMSTTFANNITGATTQVFSGSVSVPAYASTPGGIGPFFAIPLAQSFTLTTANGNLLIDITANGGGSSVQVTLDGSLPGGTARFIGTTGPTSQFSRLDLLVAGNGSQGRFSGLIPDESFVLFAQSQVQYSGAMLLGATEIAPTFSLSGQGMPGNFLYHIPSVATPFTMTFSPIGGWRAVFNLNIPDDPLVVFATLWAQAVVVDPPANPRGLVLTRAQKITFGEELPHPLNQVSSSDPAATSGFARYTGGIPGGAVLRVSGTFQ
ncbi:MAG: hypothetical protein AAF628_31015 [Planctomycetota bacterium]